MLLAGCAIIAATSIMHGAATPACDPGNGGITLPAGFCAFVAVDGIGSARHMAVAPNGDVYVSLMGGRGGQGGGVVALRDKDGDGRFETKETFGKASSTGIGASQRLSLCGDDDVRRAL